MTLGRTRPWRRIVGGRRLEQASMVFIVAATVLALLPVKPAAASAPASAADLADVPPGFQPPQPVGSSASIHLASPPASSNSAPTGGSTAGASGGTSSSPSSSSRPDAPPPDAYTAFTHSTFNGDGTVTTEVFGAPHFTKSGGTWHVIDAAVQARTDSAFPLGADSAFRPVHFGSGAGNLVQLLLDHGPVTLSSSSLTAGVPQLGTEGHVHYPSVSPGTDLEYAVSDGAIKESLVLTSAAAPLHYTFFLADPANQLGGVTQRPDGGYWFAADIDGARLGIAPATAYEQAGQPSQLGPMPVPGSAHEAVTQVKGGYDITVSIDAQWLVGKHFPIVLDPTFDSTTPGTVYGAGSTNPHSANPCFNGTCALVTSNTQLDTGSFYNAGYPNNDYEPARSWYRWNLAQTIPTGSRVNSASFSAYVAGCTGPPIIQNDPYYYCNQHNYSVQLNAMTADWNAGQPWSTLASEMSASSFAQVSLPGWNIAYSNGVCTGCPTMTFNDQQFQSQVQSWVNTPSSNYGFVMRTADDATLNDEGPSVDFQGTVSGTRHTPPSLTVTYTPPPGTPIVTANAGDASAVVSWQAASTNGGDPIDYYAVFEYISGNPTPVTGTNVCATCLTTTFISLTDGTTYVYAVFAHSDVGYGTPGISNPVTPEAAPKVTKTVSPVQALYARGQVVTWTVTVSNPQPSSMAISGITDALAAVGALASPSLLVDGLPCTGLTAPACLLSGTTLSVGGFTLAPFGNAGDHHVFSYRTVLAGLERGCTTAVNTATVTNALTSGVASLSLPICDSGLGLESWWSYVTRALGPQATASVNVANGNLVLQQTDSTPVQGHGRIGLVLRRTYNSEDTTLVTFGGSLGKGWQFNVAQTDDLAGLGLSTAGLVVPTLESVLNPLAVTLVDRDGTRHVFQFKGIGVSSPLDLTAVQGSGGVLGSLLPLVLRVLTSGNHHLCLDETFTSPAGVHLGLWRYIDVISSANSNPCGTPDVGTTPNVLGFEAVRPDRTRYEFAWDGHMVAMSDASGNRLVYAYENQLLGGSPLGRLTSITEPSTGRAFTFRYAGQAYGPLNQTCPANSTCVTDPAQRSTLYAFDGALPAAHLTTVTNTDGSQLTYTYGGCGGTADQLCSASDPRTNTTRFTYTNSYGDGSGMGGEQLPHVATITDRRGSATQLTYYHPGGSTLDWVTSDQAGHRQRFLNIDASGRVGEIDEGDTSDNYAHQTIYAWDAPGTLCRAPDNIIDNDLCAVERVSANSSTPLEFTSYYYNPEGQQTVEARATSLSPVTQLVTTTGYHVQYFEASGSVNCFDDVLGASTVTSTAVSAPSPCSSSGTRGGDTQTLFAVSDRTQSLTPRGNNAGSGFAAYETTYKVDDNTAISPNVVTNPSPDASQARVCVDPTAPTSNTGLVCEVDAPTFDGTHPTITRSTYNSNGQKLTFTSPKAIAETAVGQTPPATTYVYYPDPGQSLDGTQTRDLSGTTPSGGWLKAVVDPSGQAVVFAYDAAGNVARTWDRNATARDAAAGKGLIAFPGTAAAPPSADYTETLRAASPTASPWRYVVSQRDQLGDLTTDTVDANGNQTTVRPPRGNAAGSAAYDVTQTFDQNDNLTQTLTPFEANTANFGSAKPTTYTYDAFNNRISMTDPDQAVSVYVFDTVNRHWATAYTIGPWPSDTSTAPPSCRESVATDAPIPVGRIFCVRFQLFDMVDNGTQSFDGNGQPTSMTYDAVHRKIRQLVRRDSTTNPVVDERTDWVYDADGNVTDVCPPREFTDGASTHCTSTGVYSTHTAYDAAGRRIAVSTYRSSGYAADTTRLGYDGDGNLVSTTDANGHLTTDRYDLLDRKVEQDAPRDATTVNRTFWNHDAAGDVTSLVQPGLATGSGVDGALTVDGSAGSTAGNPYRLTNGHNYSSIALVNGGWITADPANGGTLQVWVTGTVSICSTCGITVAGLGAGGGQAGGLLSGGGAGSGPGAGGGGAFNAAGGGGGGGGGHAAAGAGGSQPLLGGAGGAGGSVFGAASLNGQLELGSGGGGGGSAATAGAIGGSGGGAVHLTASDIQIQSGGQVVADGAAGGSVGIGGGGAGGGGSGGSVWLTATTISLGSATALSVRGGAPGQPYGILGGGAGGAGAAGRVRLDVAELSGTVPGTGWGSTFRTYVGRITAYSFDAALRPVDSVAGADNVDATQAGTAAADGSANVRTRQVYDADGHVVARYDPRAFTSSTTSPDPLFATRTEYDVDGRPVAHDVPRYDNTADGGLYADQGLSTTQSSQCFGGIAGYPSSTHVCVTRAAYDPAGRVTSVILPTSATPLGTTAPTDNRYVAYSYTDTGALAQTDAPSPDPTSSAPASCPSTHTASGPRATSCTVFDADLLAVKTVDPLGRQTTASRYADTRVRSVIDQPNGSITHVTQYTYDGNGNRSTMTDPAGHVTTYAYWTNDRLLDTVDAAGDPTVQVVDGVGNISAVYSPSAWTADATNPHQIPSSTTFTADNLPLTVTEPLSTDGTQLRRTTYTYDQGGRKTAQHMQLVSNANPTAVLADGGTQTFSYLPDDRLAQETGRDGATIATSYDAAGHRTQIADTDATWGSSTITAAYTLDGLPAVVSEDGRTTRYTYDGSGARAARADVNGGTTTTTQYTYGDAEVPTQMVSGAVQGAAATYSYDADGALTGQTDANGERVARSYNPDGTLASQALTTSGASTLATWTYQYDADFRQTQQAFSGAGAGGATPQTATFTYGYDAAGRLSSLGYGGSTQTITWDHDGNRLSDGDVVTGQATTFTYNADNSLHTTLSAGVTHTSSYQAFGGVTSDGCATYTYDGFDRLARVAQSAGSGCASTPTTTTYSTDGLDRQRTSSTPSSSDALHYDGLGMAVAAETTTASAEITYALDAAGKVAGLTAHPSGGAVTQYLTDDGQGNISTATTTGQAVACTARFDPFGTALGATAGACNTGSTPSAFFYRGGRRDPATGEYAFGPRTYDPGKAAFLTPDTYRTAAPAATIGLGSDPLTADRYSYVNGDPVNFEDPTGHDAWWVDTPGYRGPIENAYGPSGCPAGAYYCTADEHYAAVIAADDAAYRAELQRVRAENATADAESSDPFSIGDLVGGIGAALNGVVDSVKSTVSCATHGWGAVANVVTAGNLCALEPMGQTAVAIAGDPSGFVHQLGESSGCGTGRLSRCFGFIATDALIAFATKKVVAVAARGAAAIDAGAGARSLGPSTVRLGQSSVDRARGLMATEAIPGESINLADSDLGSFSRPTNSFGEAAPEGQGYTYGPFKPARTPGDMAGSRGVKTIDTSSGGTLGWQYETYDAAGNVRIVRPQLDTGPGPHYYYDANGNLTGIR